MGINAWLPLMLGDGGRRIQEEKTADARHKSDIILLLAGNLLEVDNFEMLPRMIKPLTLEALKEKIIPLGEKLLRDLRPQK